MTDISAGKASIQFPEFIPQQELDISLSRSLNPQTKSRVPFTQSQKVPGPLRYSGSVQNKAHKKNKIKISSVLQSLTIVTADKPNAGTAFSTPGIL